MSIDKRYVATGIGASLILVSAYFVYDFRPASGELHSPRQDANLPSRADESADQTDKSADVLVSAQPHVQRSTAGNMAAAVSSNTQTTSLSPAVTGKVSTPRQFDVERQFVKVSADGTKQKFNGDTVRSTLMQDFQGAVQALQNQAFNDATAGELNNSYRSAIVEQLSQTDPSARLSNFACGIQVCFGQIDMGSDASTWQEWHKKFYADSRTPSYVFMEYDIQMADGSVQRRFAITIDPKLNAVDVAPPS